MRALTGMAVRTAATMRAADLHHLFVMLSQDDIRFPTHERLLLQARVWLCDRICGPLHD